MSTVGKSGLTWRIHTIRGTINRYQVHIQRYNSAADAIVGIYRDKVGTNTGIRPSGIPRNTEAKCRSKMPVLIFCEYRKSFVIDVEGRCFINYPPSLFRTWYPTLPFGDQEPGKIAERIIYKYFVHASLESHWLPTAACTAVIYRHLVLVLRRQKMIPVHPILYQVPYSWICCYIW